MQLKRVDDSFGLGAIFSNTSADRFCRTSSATGGAALADAKRLGTMISYSASRRNFHQLMPLPAAVIA